MGSETINVKGLNRADVLAVLYNSSKPQMMGFMSYDPEPMTREGAQKLLDAGQTYFDYLNGRIMKIDLSEEEINTWLYDRDNGQGAAERAISSLEISEDTNPEIVAQIHKSKTRKSAEEVRRLMNTKNLNEQTYILKEKGKPSIAHLGLSDVGDSLGPKVDKAIKKLDDLKE